MPLVKVLASLSYSGAGVRGLKDGNAEEGEVVLVLGVILAVVLVVAVAVHVCMYVCMYVCVCVCVCVCPRARSVASSAICLTPSSPPSVMSHSSPHPLPYL